MNEGQTVVLFEQITGQGKYVIFEKFIDTIITRDMA